MPSSNTLSNAIFLLQMLSGIQRSVKPFCFTHILNAIQSYTHYPPLQKVFLRRYGKKSPEWQNDGNF